MLAALAAVCQWVGAVVLASLLVWLVGTALDKLRPLRLLDDLPSRAVLITGTATVKGDAHHTQTGAALEALAIQNAVCDLESRRAARLVEIVLRLWLRARTGAPPGRSGGAGVRGLPVPEGPGARRLAADCSSRLRVLPLDVTSDQQVADAVVSVQAALADASGTELWAVLNNAGIADIGETDVTPLEKFKQVLDVNTVGAIRVSKAFLPLLKKSKGRLINVNSPCGRVPIPMLSPYCVSKSALIMFTDMLRMEMKKWSITVSSVQPSFYETPMADVERLQVKYFENTEKTLPDDIRQAARKNCEVLLRGSKWFALKNISEVIDEMVSACVGRDVQRVHMPGFIPTIIMTVAANLPDWLREILIQIIMVIIKIIWG